MIPDSFQGMIPLGSRFRYLSFGPTYHSLSLSSSQIDAYYANATTTSWTGEPGFRKSIPHKSWIFPRIETEEEGFLGCMMKDCDLREVLLSFSQRTKLWKMQHFTPTFDPCDPTCMSLDISFLCIPSGPSTTFKV